MLNIVVSLIGYKNYRKFCAPQNLGNILIQVGHTIMNIHKEWFTWGDSYELDILDPDYELISLGIVLAIDTAMAAANTASSAST